MRLNKTFIFLLVLSIITFSCKEDDSGAEPCVVPDYSINLKVDLQLNGSDVAFFEDYSVDGQTISFSTFKMYLSDIKLIKANGEVVLGDEIGIIDFNDKNPNGQKNTISFEAPAGDYSAIEFGVGVKGALNDQDPATYELSHPLSLNSGMYWAWSTQYKFIMAEGNAESKAWLIHPGTNPMYQEGITLSKNFTIDESDEVVELVLNFNKVLNGDKSVDLVNNGISHTTDHYDVAENFIINVSKAFE